MIKVLNFLGLSLYKTEKQLQEENTRITTELGNYVNVQFNRNKLQAWARKVKKSGKCDCCSSEENLEAHHLWSKSRHPTIAYEKDNGVSLCRECHFKFHKEFPDIKYISPKKYKMFKTIQQGKQAQTNYNIMIKNIEHEEKTSPKK